MLILEDSPVDAELILRELRQAQFEPEWQRVQTEPAFLAALDPAPDLILADYNLPQFDGIRAVKLLRERRLDIPFILISGSLADETAILAIQKHGVDDYLAKDRLARLGPAECIGPETHANVLSAVLQGLGSVPALAARPVPKATPGSSPDRRPP